MSTELKAKSRENFSTENNDADSIKLGCLQRIADATEVMAKYHYEVMADLEYYKKKYREQCEITRELSKKLDYKQRLITRYKNQIENLKTATQ